MVVDGSTVGPNMVDEIGDFMQVTTQVLTSRLQTNLHLPQILHAFPHADHGVLGIVRISVGQIFTNCLSLPLMYSGIAERVNVTFLNTLPTRSWKMTNFTSSSACLFLYASSSNLNIYLYIILLFLLIMSLDV